jgi:hypothetical protein
MDHFNLSPKPIETPIRRDRSFHAVNNSRNQEDAVIKPTNGPGTLADAVADALPRS